MKTTAEKLNQANWNNEILKKMNGHLLKISFCDERGGFIDQLEMFKHEHPTVIKYYQDMQELVIKMRSELQCELDGLFK